MSALDPVPSLASRPSVRASAKAPASATALGVAVGASGPVPAELGLTRRQLTSAGFDGSVGATLTIPGSKPVLVAVGVGDPSPDHVAVRDAAGAFGRATATHTKVALQLPDGADAAAAVEGVVLSRYRYDSLRTTGARAALSELTIVGGDKADVTRGAVLAAATAMSRDLANSPHSHLTASKLADLAVALAPECGYTVEVYGKEELQEMGCGGLLGVNQGSTEPPRMVVMTYDPPDADGHLALVGKGIMYDSGGLSLKPGDEVHAQMKNDMSGAAAVMAAFAHLQAAGCTSKVTGYLMCTDNMPSGTAMALGDVITMRGGTTVEVINTDAEGRLVMADALVLASEMGCDAVVDIATLTGACMRALGTRVGGLFANDDTLAAQILAAADDTDEPLWRLPLVRRYRAELNSTVADLRNLGGANGGAITAALFLEEFVDGVPWAHVDIAGTAQTPADGGWHTAGCSGFGARMLVQLACDFTAPGAAQ